MGHKNRLRMKDISTQMEKIESGKAQSLIKAPELVAHQPLWNIRVRGAKTRAEEPEPKRRNQETTVERTGVDSLEHSLASNPVPKEIGLVAMTNLFCELYEGWLVV